MIISKGVIIGAIVIALIAVVFLSRSNSTNEQKQTPLQTVSDCETITINTLREIAYQDGDFQETSNGWQVGPQKNTNTSLSQVFPLAYYPDCSFTSGTVSVDFKLIEGKEDKYAGLVLGLTSPGDYYVVRASGSENNAIIAKFVNGKREKLQTIDTGSLSSNEWHTLKLDITNNAITVVVDNKQVIQDFPLQAITGRIGVNTKSDSVTQFRNLIIQPSGEATPVSTPTPTVTSSSSGQASDIVDEQGIANATVKIQQALSAPSASQMQSLLINEAVLGSNSGGQIGEASTRQEVINWLNNHWSNNLQYISRHYVGHFGYWEIEISGWSNMSSTPNSVYFRLFKYDANDQRTIGEGNWLIYAVLY